MKTELLKVEKPVIGQLYHLAWAKNGCVWRLLEIHEEHCKMVTPKTGKIFLAKISDLRHTRKTEAKIKAIDELR